MNDLFLAVLSAIPNDLRGLFPEILLSTAILLGCILEWGTDAAGKKLVVWFCAISAVATLALSWILGNQAGGQVPTGLFAPDSITFFIRMFSLTAAVLALLAINGSSRMAGRDELGEAGLLILATALGAMLFASARHLLALYLGLEFLSLSSYALAGFRAHDARATEAGIKYLLYGAVASGVALFGISHIWGMTGTFDIAEAGGVLAGMPRLGLVPVILLGVAFAYKLGLVPFHFWSPDVYQGCPTVAAGFLSTVPKAAAFGALLHTLPWLVPQGAFGLSAFSVGGVFATLAGISVLVGSATALVQKDAKRLLAFSSTTNSGIMLLGISTWITREAVAGIGLYLLAYLAANLGTFLALDALEKKSGSTTLDALAGSWKRSPGIVVALSVCVFSLAGIPPLAGFAGKWAVLAEVVRTGTEDGFGIPLFLGVVLALVGSVVLAAAYLKLLRAVVVDDPTTDGLPEGWRAPFLSEVPLFLCTVASVLLGLGWPLLAVFRSRLPGG